jgi:hypothetical protein
VKERLLKPAAHSPTRPDTEPIGTFFPKVSPGQPTVQRQSAECEEEAKTVSRQTGEAASHTPPSTPVGFSEQLSRKQGSGFTLQAGFQSQMESAFGSDFSAVRVHTDEEASRMSQQINARAFTYGHDIYFNSGKYDPASPTGQKLLAHELTHVVQQQSGVQRKQIQRAVSEADVEAEYGKWAADNKKTTDRTKDDFPMDVWDFIRPQLLDSSTMEPLPKPKDAKKLKEWTAVFEKGEIIARWLLSIRSNAKSSDTLKEFADTRALMVLDALAKAGLVSQAMTQSTGLSAERRKFLYETVLKNPSAASAGELTTIVAFQSSSVADPASVPIVQSLTDRNTNDLKKLNAVQTKALLGTLIKIYGKKDTIIQAIAEVLLFNPGVRVAISDAMMKSDIGNPDLLFAVLKHPYFIEPEYGAQLLQALVPAGKTNEDYDKERMKTDMPWVYTYKQKYYVQYLIDLAKAQSITIDPPAKMDFSGLKPWLEANTEKIGEAAKKAYPSNPKAVFELYKNIADIFFYHVPHDRDVEPDLEGKISHLKPGAPSKERFEADCDIFATYAMRLFYNAGFQPIGYLAIVPDGAFKDRAAHVAGLMRKDNAYYVINNKGILDPKQTETKADEKKEDAIKAMFKLALRDAYADPLPTERKIYYQDAGPKGQMTKAFKDQDSSLLRTNIP